MPKCTEWIYRNFKPPRAAGLVTLAEILANAAALVFAEADLALIPAIAAVARALPAAIPASAAAQAFAVMAIAATTEIPAAAKALSAATPASAAAPPFAAADSAARNSHLSPSGKCSHWGAFADNPGGNLPHRRISLRARFRLPPAFSTRG